MPIIKDPDLLNVGTEIIIDAAAKTISLVVAGNLSNDGVTGICLYSFLKEEWRNDANLIKVPFPMVSITSEQFEFIEGWVPGNDSTRKLIRFAAWAELNASGQVAREYAGIVSLGNIGGSDQPYFLQENNGSPEDFAFSGPVNEVIQIYGDATNGNFDRRGFLKLFVREQGKKYAQASLSDAGLTSLTYQVYRFPLANDADLKIVETDANIAANAPYTGITITYHSTPVQKTIGASSYDFNWVVEGNGASLEQIYEKVQYLLRQNADIDSGAGTSNGKITDELLTFVGDNLTTSTSVFVENFDASDTNRLTQTDDGGTARSYPFVAALTLNFNEFLQNDTQAVYRVFFKDANGNAFGDSSAILVKDASDVDMAGNVSSNASIAHTFDYDNNAQGGRTPNQDAVVVVVAIGLDTGQYVKAEATIRRSTENTASLVAAQERNYANP